MAGCPAFRLFHFEPDEDACTGFPTLIGAGV